MQVQVIKKPLKYGTKLYSVGEPVTMTSKHARDFLALRRVRVPDATRLDIPAAPLPVTLVATPEPESVPGVPSESVPEVGVEERRPRRQYRRRDVRPENRDPQAED